MIVTRSGVNDAAELETALRSTGAASATAHLTGISATAIGAGAMADTFRVSLTWQDPDSGPPSAVVKQPAQDSAAATTAASLGAYEREARFYTELAPHTDVRVPRLLGVSGTGAEGIPNTIVLEDLSENYRPGDQIGGTALRDVQRARRQLALLQAPFWDETATADLAWLHRRIGVPIPGILRRMHESWHSARTDFDAALSPDQRACIDRFVENAETWAASAFGPFSLVHHDYRVDNMLFSPTDVVAIDWQTIGWGPAMFDVAYLLGTSMNAELRRAEEQAEIRTHLDELEDLGVTWDHDAAWDAYRWSAFSILFMLVPPITSVKSNARMEAMFARLLALGAQMALDLDSLDFLPD